MNPPTCPNCGADLACVVGPPSWAPWLCEGCARGWWNAELTAEARASWRPERRSHSLLTAGRVRGAIEAERDAAEIRGVSVTIESIPLLTTEQRAQVRDTPGVSGTVLAAMKGR